jgi:magnesium transporter
MRSEQSSKDISWVDLQEPSNEELAAFVREVDLSPTDAEFIVRDHQRPEITVRPHYILLLVHVPVYDKKIRVTSGAALYCLITAQKIYSLHYQPVVALQKIIKDFSDHPAKQEEYFGDSALSLALYIVSMLNEASFRKIGRLTKHIQIAEDAIFHGNERKMVEEIAVLTRDVLDFRTIIRPQVTLFQSAPSGLPTDDDIPTQWQRVASQYTQLWEILGSLLESTKELRDTNDSLLQYKENELLRMLTIYSIIAIPVWIFVSPYNPRGAQATAIDIIVFWGVLGLLIVFLLFIFLRSKRKRVL